MGYGYDADEGKRLWMQTRAAPRAKYPTCECNVVLLQIGCTIAVHTGPCLLYTSLMEVIFLEQNSIRATISMVTTVSCQLIRHILMNTDTMVTVSYTHLWALATRPPTTTPS